MEQKTKPPKTELARELSSCGWVVIIGNESMSAQESHDIYRNKDVVEKAFMRYKDTLGMSRLRVHDGERMGVAKRRV